MKQNYSLKNIIFAFAWILCSVIVANLSFGQERVKMNELHTSQKQALTATVRGLQPISSQTSSATENLEFWKNEPFGQRDASKELTEKRDAFSKHFQNDNGSITAHIASGPIHYQENGEWKTIYHTIEPASNGGFQNVYNSFKTYFPATASGEIVTILPDGAEMRDMQGMRMYYEVNGQEVGTMNIANIPGSVDFNKLTYSGVYGSQIDLRLTQNSTQRKMDYLLQSASALNGAPQNAQYLVFEEQISLPQGVAAKLVENKIMLSNAKGEVIAEYTNPDIYDEQPSVTEDENYVHRSEATYQIAQIGNVLTIRTKVQMTWLLDVNRNFPVVVDPTVNVVQFFTLAAGRYSLVRNTQNSQSFVNSESCDNVYNGDISLLVGRASNVGGNGNNARSRFYFAQTTFNLGSIPTGSTINSSQLYYYVFGYNGTGSGTLSIRRHTENQINSCGSIFSGMTNDEYFTNSTYNAGWQNGSVTPGHMQNNLAAGWFGIGYWPAGNYGGTSRYWDIDGVGLSSRPYIVVDYTEPDCGTNSTTPIEYNDNTGITNVTFNTINNSTTSNNTYVNTGISTTLCKGNTYNLSVRVNTDGAWTVRARAWIDWNNDGIFSNTTESYDLGTAFNTANGVTSDPANITVPLNAATATVKMRIVAAEISNYPHACANNFYGEGEDYTLIIQAPPTAPTGISGTTTICSGQTTTLTANGGSNGSGATFQWGTGNVGSNIIAGQTASTLTVSPTATTTYWVRRVGNTACNNTTGGTSTTVTVTPLPNVIASATSTAPCRGQEVTLTGSGATSYSWNNGVTDGEAFIPTSTNTYTVTGTSNGCSGTAQVTVTLPTVDNSLAPNNATAGCLVNQNGWVHFLDNNGRLIASVDSKGQNLGNVTATSYVEAAPLQVQDCASSILTSVLDRHWVITPQFQPTGPVEVVLPMGQNEEQSLVTNANSNSNPDDDLVGLTDIVLTKYAGPSNVDNDFQNNCFSQGGNETLDLFTQGMSGFVYDYWPSYNGNDLYASYDINSFSEFWLHGSSNLSPLPVSLTSFNANCQSDNFTEVTWETASEMNASHFIVERSRDGVSWSNEHEVDAAGNANTLNSYSFEDHNAGIGFEGYYRLLQVDFDGKETLYGPISVKCDEIKNASMEVFPNPSSGSFTLRIFNNIEVEDAKIVILDVNGKVIQQDKTNINNGITTLLYDQKQLVKGIYYIRVIADGVDMAPKKLVIN